MNRIEAHKITKSELEKYGLKDWGVRLSTNINDGFLGLCSYKDNVIILNAHHVDIHSDQDVINTIKHEVAHALCPKQGHNEIWRNKAKEIGCDNTLPCSNLDLPEHIIDAIRSGNMVEVEIEEETHVVRHPKFKVTRLQDKCPDCGKVAVEKFHTEFINKSGDTVRLITLTCFHILTKVIPRGTPFENFISNGWNPEVKNCKHEWNKTQCMKCNEHRMYPFQVLGAKACESGLSTQKGFGIFDDMGLGKTIQDLAVIHFHPEYTPTLYVTKSAITFQWFKQIIRWLGPTHLPQIIRTSRDRCLPGFKSYIISYDLLKRFPSTELDKIGIKCVVLDECQQIKNPDSSRTQEVRRLVSKADIKVIPLSGTPWKNRGSEFFPVLNMLAPMKFHSYQNFINRWCDYYEHGNKTKMGGIRNIKEFREYTQDIMIRREYNEVMDELPEINRLKLNIQLDELTQSTYDESVSEFVKWYNDAVISGEEDNVSSIELLGRMSRMRHITGLAKIPATVGFVEEFIEDTNRKLVIFVHHKDVGELLFDECKKVSGEIQVLKYNAEQDDFQRSETQDKFNRLDRAIMIASTLACGEGVNLQTCSDAIMHERQWNPQNEEQASPGRFRRIGQKASSINTTYVEAEGTIDEWIDTLVENKRVAFHKTMNKSEMGQWTGGDMGRELAELIVNKHKSKNKGKTPKKVSQFARL